jgi:hypothetical protein
MKRGARREGVLKTAGIIVEGQTERDALPLLHTKKLVRDCPPMSVINLEGVGSHLAPIGVARRVLPKVIEHQVKQRTPIVVCIDREQRDATADEFAKAVLTELTALLRAKGRQANEVRVAMADRAFEAWILADARGLHRKKMFVRGPAFHSFEGAMGKQQKKGVVELGELLGREYRKTGDGPRLFEKLDFVAARDHGGHGSVSLDSFLRMLGV